MFKTTDSIPNWLSLWGMGILRKGSFYILYTLLLAFSKQACPFYLKIFKKKFNECIMKKYTVSRKFNFKFLFLHAVIFKNLLLMFFTLCLNLKDKQNSFFHKH